MRSRRTSTFRSCFVSESAHLLPRAYPTGHLRDPAAPCRSCTWSPWQLMSPDNVRTTWRIMGRRISPSSRRRKLLPHDNYPHRLPDPIPASYYARGEAPAWMRWAAITRGTAAMARVRPPRTVLVAGAVAAAAVVLIGLLVALARHPAPAGDQIAQASPPPERSTPLAAAPTPTAETPTPTPTPTPRPTPTPTPRPTPALTILTPRLQARAGRSVTLQATTQPGITCTIVVGYSPSPQLGPVPSDDSGAVSWNWSVSSQVRPGSYQIQVSCGGAMAGATITVIGRGGGQG
jgi:hypothetical protein